MTQRTAGVERAEAVSNVLRHVALVEPPLVTLSLWPYVGRQRLASTWTVAPLGRMREAVEQLAATPPDAPDALVRKRR